MWTRARRHGRCGRCPFGLPTRTDDAALRVSSWLGAPTGRGWRHRPARRARDLGGVASRAARSRRARRIRRRPARSFQRACAAHVRDRPSPISPRRAGAILWTDEDSVMLEGRRGSVSGERGGLRDDPATPGCAAWVLEWDPDDLESPVLAALRLLVNTNDTQLLRRFGPAAPTSAAAAVRASSPTTSHARLCTGRCSTTDSSEDPEIFEDGSLGRMLFELLSTTWPGIPIRDAAQARASKIPRASTPRSKRTWGALMSLLYRGSTATRRRHGWRGDRAASRRSGDDARPRGRSDLLRRWAAQGSRRALEVCRRMCSARSPSTAYRYAHDVSRSSRAGRARLHARLPMTANEASHEEVVELPHVLLAAGRRRLAVRRDADERRFIGN